LLPKRVLNWLHFVDKAGIYLLIAGTCETHFACLNRAIALVLPARHRRRCSCLLTTLRCVVCSLYSLVSVLFCFANLLFIFLYFFCVCILADTPFLVILFPAKRAWSVWLLSLVWAVASVGIVVAAVLPTSKLKARISLSLYLVMGWSALVTYSVQELFFC
jgi:predicted membrane channel-forming protein YqfA (hemolysin III family)